MNGEPRAVRPVESRVALLTVVAFAAATGTYTLGVLTGFGQEFETSLTVALRSLPTAGGTVAVATKTVAFGLLISAVAVGLVAVSANRGWRGVWIPGFSSLSGLGVAHLLQLVLPRPDLAGNTVWSAGASFPAPLVAAAVALTSASPPLFAAPARRRALLMAWWPAVLTVLLCAGLWYRLTDVVGGALIGVAAALVVCGSNRRSLLPGPRQTVNVPQDRVVRAWASAAAVLLLASAATGLASMTGAEPVRAVFAVCTVACVAAVVGLLGLTGALAAGNAIARADLIRGTEVPEREKVR